MKNSWVSQRKCSGNWGLGLPDHSPGDFIRASEVRLALALDMFEQDRGLPFGERYIEMANVAMLVWSAGIDLISVHMLLDGERDLGTSASRRRYLLNRIVPGNRSLQLRAGWGGLSRLHSFQHNLHLSQAEFAANCRDGNLIIAGLDSLLSTPLWLAPDVYGWLAEVG